MYQNFAPMYGWPGTPPVSMMIPRILQSVSFLLISRMSVVVHETYDGGDLDDCLQFVSAAV
jgi:hypothetical protein